VSILPVPDKVELIPEEQFALGEADRAIRYRPFVLITSPQSVATIEGTGKADGA
jgi:hypothetical protein